MGQGLIRESGALTMRIVREGDLHLIIGRSLPSQFPSQIGRMANVHKNDLRANGVTATARMSPFITIDIISVF